MAAGAPSASNRRGRPARLVHPALAHEQVQVPEHLRERQVRLGDGDVAPHLQRDLVRGERPAAEHPQDLARAALVHAQPLVDQRRVVDDRLAVAGQRPARPAARAWPASSRCSRSAPAVASRAARRRSSGRETSGLEEMCASRWSPAISIRRSSSQKIVSEGCGRGGGGPRSCGRAAASTSPSCSCRWTGPARAERAERGAHRAERGGEIVRAPRGGASSPGRTRRRRRRSREVRQVRARAHAGRRPRRPSGGRGSRAARDGPCAGG